MLVPSSSPSASALGSKFFAYEARRRILGHDSNPRCEFP